MMTRYFCSWADPVAVMVIWCHVQVSLFEDPAPPDTIHDPVGIGATLDGNVSNGDNTTPLAVAALLILWSFTEPTGGSPGRLHIGTIVDDANELPRGGGRELTVPRPRGNTEGCK